MDRRLTREALRLMERHEPFVRAMVVNAIGSVPGKIGASMIIRGDRSFLGTVGGAALEEKVKEHAAHAMRIRRGELLHFDLQKWKEGGLPSWCGGSVDIAIEYVPARPNLLLWGGGHVAQALANLLPALEYDFSVADDRPEWVGADRFREAERREVVPPSELWDRFDPSAFTHLYLLGYDAVKDTELLRLSVDRFSGWIGVIASAAKRERMLASLREAGVGRAALARVHSPVGVAIRAETPAEIAVSIVAELIQEQHPRAPEPPVRAGSEKKVPVAR
ncbi:MAG: XdhC/CoxI family protein [Thermoplasmata archaeon]|nr:XdhC/CoxI family protein [Thermoplasmata archaeon]MCI4344500.1 XdhC/CoxI family protein [Thermoplasmata archaeon]